VALKSIFPEEIVITESSDSSSSDEELEEEASDVGSDAVISDCSSSDNSDSESPSEDEDPPPAEQLMGRNGRVWQAAPPNYLHQAPAHNIIREQPGLTPSGRGNTSILDSFTKVFTNDIVQQIVRWTNQRLRSHPSAKATDDVEIRAVIGLLILLGVWRSNNENLSELWASDTGRATFRATMTLSRFQELLRSIRFDDQQTREERRKTDKLAPIRDLWEMLLFQLERQYRPSAYLTIDEQLLGTRGRCSFKQYIPSKPSKYGIKINWICDNANSYPLKGEIYVGRQPNADPEESAKFNQPQQLVKRLVNPWKQSGRNITCDNYFTSVPLALDLLALRTTLVGTMRKNKADIPPQLQASRGRAVNSSLFGFTDQMTLVSYVPKKNRSVILLSTMHHDNAISQSNSSKPEMILMYNHTKGGVDTLDRRIREYTVKRKSLRWTMTVFYNMIDVAAVASFVIWHLEHPTWHSAQVHHRRRIYLKQLGNELVCGYLQRRMANPYALQKGVPLALKALGYSIQHQKQNEEGAPAQKRSRCAYCPCRGPGGDRKTKTTCSVCNKPICNAHQSVTCYECLMG
jgi:hypothetical protein